MITTYPVGDRSLKRQTKKDHLIYSSPGLDAATTSNSSAVSRPGSVNVGATPDVLPASDKSNGLVGQSISQNNTESNNAVNNGQEDDKSTQVVPAETEHFTAGTFTHTKTGQKIPRAKIKGKTDKYKAILAVAKKHGGIYSRFAKCFGCVKNFV